MRALIILRGAMGAGKSSWLRENNLEPYTLSPDTIRLMYSSPQMQIEGYDYTISQKNDTAVWALLFELRMKKGELTIIDATHSRQSDFSRYNSLCETYRYRRYYVDFTDVPIEICKARNMHRLPTFKVVPTAAIDKCYARFATQPAPKSWVKIERDDILKFLNPEPFNFDEYDKIHIFGDIHGCYEPLKEYLDKYTNWQDGVLPTNEMFIFTGDYVDRGIQNKETMELLCKLCKLPNTLFLPGNHEEWLRMFVFGDIDGIRSKEFRNKTMYELKDISHNELANFVRKLGQIAFFTYDRHIYFVSHGGVPYIPHSYLLVATDQYIHGVGVYSDDIDDIYSNYGSLMSEMVGEQAVPIQIHGHRNTFGIKTDEYPYTYNLEGRIEFGGDLRVLVLEKGKEPQPYYIKNNVYNPESVETKVDVPLEKIDNIIEALRGNPYIRETELGNDISSFNFTRDAFYDKEWNSITTKARGLFMNTKTGEVVARAYNKFFNINERDDTKMLSLRSKIENGGQQAIAYKKYNGYLGILSYYNSELHFYSKSTDKGNFAEWFKEIFMSQHNAEQIEGITNYMKEHNCSFVYEVIDPVNDPHIIKNEQREVILLDIINNSLEFHKLPYDDLQKFARGYNLKCKQMVAIFKDFRSLMKFYLDHTDEENLSDTNIEGVVIEIGDFMTKLKFTYYNYWKFCRSLLEKARLKRYVKPSMLYNDRANYFYAWLKEQPQEILEKDIITLRDMFESNR